METVDGSFTKGEQPKQSEQAPLWKEAVSIYNAPKDEKPILRFGKYSITISQIQGVCVLILAIFAIGAIGKIVWTMMG